MNNRIKELQEDIEELSIQLSDMLCVALILLGVREDKIEAALDLYLEALEEQEGFEYGQKEILAILEQLKTKHPNLFGPCS